MHRTVTGARWLRRASVTHAVIEANRPLHRSRLPFGVKGGCGRLAVGTADQPPAPEIPGAARHLRFVPLTDIRCPALFKANRHFVHYRLCSP